MFKQISSKDTIEYALVENFNPNNIITTASIQIKTPRSYIDSYSELKNNNKDIFLLHDFFTKNEQNRGKGNGRKLLNYIKESLENNIIILTIHPNNNKKEELIKFYKSEGFKMIFPNNNEDNSFLMMAEL